VIADPDRAGPAARMLSARLTFQRWRYPWWRHSTATPAGRAGLDVLNPRPQDLSFGLGMFRDHDVVVSLTRMTAVLVDASLRVVERLVAAQPAAQPAPNNVVRPRVLPSLSFHSVHCARLREIDVATHLAEPPSRAPALRTPAGSPNTPMLPDAYLFVPASGRVRVTAHPSYRIGPGRDLGSVRSQGSRVSLSAVPAWAIVVGLWGSRVTICCHTRVLRP